MIRKRKTIIHISVSAAIIIAGSILMVLLTSAKSELQKIKPSTPAPMVRVMKIKTGPESMIIRGGGTVSPLHEIGLIPQVGGKIGRISPYLVNGGMFRKNDPLLSINPVDYELAVTLARAKVRDSESNLKIIQEEALVAREEWRVHYSTNNSHAGQEIPPLVAKEPQLTAAQAKLDADRADLKKALLNLERTVLKAPFNGCVSQKSVDIGQYVTPGQSLASIFSTETARIALPLEDKDLFWFDVPGFTPGNEPGSPATVHAVIAGHNLTFQGRVTRVEGKLDEKTRMITVIVQIDKPYATKPPLAMGLFVTVDIVGRTLPNAAIIPRAALRRGDTVWTVNDEGVLRFKTVTVARNQGEEIIIESGLKDGETVIFSPLKAATDGMTVRTVKDQQ
ncbi:MAG: efflux RND transporter periplasmic adaptor subunit [Thermodesulfobacteriota bacterium]|nr:efflux RND transporter periplasmic adaptor subunit [Thermodesulfobacteriota bacterium]